jgi:hypothetical protein
MSPFAGFSSGSVPLNMAVVVIVTGCVGVVG